MNDTNLEKYRALADAFATWRYNDTARGYARRQARVASLELARCHEAGGKLEATIAKLIAELSG